MVGEEVREGHERREQPDGEKAEDEGLQANEPDTCAESGEGEDDREEGEDTAQDCDDIAGVEDGWWWESIVSQRE